MKRNLFCLCLIFVTVLCARMVSASEKEPVETVLDGCKKEITTYCKDVTLGEGRLLACLYAHNDKLSGRCEYALYDAAAQLERAIASLTYVANECDNDLEKYCSSIKPGEGRLLKCIEKHENDISERCTHALKDVKLKK